MYDTAVGYGPAGIGVVLESLDSAHIRLEQALDRLEAAAERAIFSAGQAQRAADATTEAIGEELAQLREDRDRLNNTLLSTKKKYDDIRAVSESLAGRLERVIGRLRTLLEA